MSLPSRERDFSFRETLSILSRLRCQTLRLGSRGLYNLEKEEHGFNWGSLQGSSCCSCCGNCREGDLLRERMGFDVCSGREFVFSRSCFRSCCVTCCVLSFLICADSLSERGVRRLECRRELAFESSGFSIRGRLIMASTPRISSIRRPLGAFLLNLCDLTTKGDRARLEPGELEPKLKFFVPFTSATSRAGVSTRVATLRVARTAQSQVTTLPIYRKTLAALGFAERKGQELAQVSRAPFKSRVLRA